MDEYIRRSEFINLVERIPMWGCLAVRMANLVPAANVVEVGNCKGCYYRAIGRQQKCSCCRRNPDMKDCYCGYGAREVDNG